MVRLGVFVDRWVLIYAVMLQGMFGMSLVLVSSYLIKIGIYDKMSILIIFPSICCFLSLMVVILMIYKLTFQLDSDIPYSVPGKYVHNDRTRERLIESIRMSVIKNDFTEVLRLQKILWGRKDI